MTRNYPSFWAKSQVRIIEGVARFDKKHHVDYLAGAKAATLIQIREAHAQYEGFGVTGEFTLAEKRDDLIFFLLAHRPYDLDWHFSLFRGSQKIKELLTK